jgi:steroid delta-isomerase-like uncharacterized protein
MDTEGVKVIGAALKRLNDAENSLASLGVEGVIRRIDEILSPSWEGGANGGPDHSRADEREFERTLFTAFPDYHRIFDDLLIDPPRAAVRWTLTGVHSGPFGGVAASGQPVKIQGMSLFEFDGGRVRRSWVYLDTAALIAQITAKRQV